MVGDQKHSAPGCCNPWSCFVTLISTFQNAELARKYGLWARVVDNIMVLTEVPDKYTAEHDARPGRIDSTM